MLAEAWLYHMAPVNDKVMCKERKVDQKRFFGGFFILAYLTRQKISYTLVYILRLDHMLMHVFRCTIFSTKVNFSTDNNYNSLMYNLVIQIYSLHISNYKSNTAYHNQ